MTSYVYTLLLHALYELSSRWVLGCYLFNLNFLDLMLLPPDARRSILAKASPPPSPAVASSSATCIL